MDAFDDGEGLALSTPVSFAKARKMAKKLGAVGFIPYSAKTQHNLHFLFNTAIDTVLNGGQAENTARCVTS